MHIGLHLEDRCFNRCSDAVGDGEDGPLDSIVVCNPISTYAFKITATGPLPGVDMNNAGHCRILMLAT